jgi:hypothetical protein
MWNCASHHVVFLNLWGKMAYKSQNWYQILISDMYFSSIEMRETQTAMKRGNIAYIAYAAVNQML